LKQLTKALTDGLRDKTAVEAKAEFLTRFVYYTVSDDDMSKKLLVDTVCSMWKQSETKRVGVSQGPISVSLDEFRRGISPDVREYLVAHGVDSNLITQIQDTVSMLSGDGQLFNVSKKPALDRAIAIVQKQSSHLALIKTVAFADGSRFELPP